MVSLIAAAAPVRETGQRRDGQGGKRDYCWSRQRDPALYDGDDYAELKSHQPFYAEFQIFEPHVRRCG